MTNPSSPIKYLKSLLRADLTVLVASRRSLIISVALPFLLLVSWNNKGSLKAFGGTFFSICIALSVGIMVLSLASYSLNVARDREKGVFQRLRVTPAPTWVIMLSRLLAYELTNLLVAIVVIVFGSRLYHISLSPIEYVLTLLVAILCGAVFLSIGQALAALIKSADTLNSTIRFVYIGLVFFGLLGLSGALGNTIEIIAKWSPLGAVVTIFEGLPHFGLWSNHTSLALLVCFGYMAIFSYIGIRWFKWDAK